MLPRSDRAQQVRRVDSPVAFGIKGDISRSAPQHGTRAGQIPVSVVIQRHRHLNQALQELFFWRWGRAPDVFQNLVGFKKGGPVEQLDALPTLLEMHATLWHRGLDPAPE